MAIELNFSKSDAHSPWGFRLVGGSDFEQPVVVVKVNKNSLAEAAGLQVGDIIVRVNDTPTARLTHAEVHDLLLSSGLEFNVGIRRGEFSTNISNEGEDYSNEISAILEEAVETDIINEAVRKVNKINEELNDRTRTDIIENLAGQEQILNSTTLDNLSDIKKGKKWSTFLVKPDKPIPEPKHVEEQRKIEGEPYRVVIKKQPRRPFQNKKVQFDDNVTEVEVEGEADEREEEGMPQSENVEIEVKVTEREEIIIEETELNNDSELEEEYEKLVDEQLTEESSEDIKSIPVETRTPWGNIKINTTIESSTPLHEQLLTVQKQLQALSQLPSTIQVTLDAISKQLSLIVDTKENGLQNGDKEDGSSSSKDEEEPLTEEEILEETEEISEKAEAELNGGNIGDSSSSIDEEIEEDIVPKDEEAREEKSSLVGEEIDEAVIDKEPDPYEGLTLEEKEAAIRKEQVDAKRQKAMDERTPRAIQRPIVLPGGRRWSNPEDAVPSFRKPKMSEEKIIETIESNLEVIVGKRKGESNCWKVPSKVIASKRINFLKYEPPAKNLDYLQRSEVFRLVHEMEPPVRGITSRPERIPAIQDYYEATKATS